MLSMKCPSCGRDLEVPDGLVGQYDTCPNCSQQFRVKRPAAQPQTSSTRKKDAMDDWTPAMGWRRAITTIGIRMAVCGALCAVGIILLAMLQQAMMGWLDWRLVTTAGFATGIPQGAIIGRNLVEKTGLDFKSLWFLMLAAIVLIFGVLYYGAIVFFIGEYVPFYYLGSAAIAIMAATTFRLLLD